MMDEIIELLQRAKFLLEETENDNLKSDGDWNIVDNEELWWIAQYSVKMLETIIQALGEI